MKTKHVFFLFVISVCLGLYIFTYESGKPAKEMRTAARTKVFSYDYSTVESFSFSNANTGQEVCLQKSGVEWKIVKPFEYPADSAKANKFLFDIQFSPAARTMDYDRELAEKLGLDSPICSFSVSSPPGISRIDFSEGRTGNAYYALDERAGRILVVEKTLIDALLALKPDDFRTSQLIRIFPQFTEKISFETQDQIVEFANMGSYWKITRPFPSRCGSKAFSELLNAIASARIRGFAEPGSIPVHMFDNSILTLKVKPAGAEAEKIFCFGPFSDDGKKIYVYQKELDTVCLADSSILKKIIPEIDKFRDMRLATEEVVKSDSIKISRGNSLIELVREKNEWKILSPSGIYAADYNAVFSYFNLFIKTEAFSVEQDGSFAEPSAKVEFGHGASVWDINFYECGEKLYAKTPADDYFLVLDASLKHKLYDSDFCRFLSKKVMSFSIAEILSVKITDGEGTFSFGKNEKNRWTGNGDAALINDLLWRLMEMKAEKVSTAETFGLSGADIPKPYLTIELSDGKETHALKIFPHGADSFLAVKDGSGFVYLIQPEIADIAGKITGGK
ncbi:MAG: DUF4340 domain-containing protein [bacterium]|nr:DUF4340 domain-containing protein [bacterium]